MKYLVTVTRTFCEEVEANSSEEAEELVRNMDWFYIQQEIDVDVEEIE